MLHRATRPLIPFVSFLYNINTVSRFAYCITRDVFVFVFLLTIVICIVIVQVLNKDRRCMNQHDCLHLSCYLQNVLFWLGYLIQG